MPKPLGQEPRDKKFLLRMTEKEDAFVRSIAQWKKTALNDAITGLIRDAMAAAQASAPRTAPKPEPEPKRPSAGKERRKGTAKLTWSDVEQMPGQTAVTDPDQ